MNWECSCMQLLSGVFAALPQKAQRLLPDALQARLQGRQWQEVASSPGAAASEEDTVLTGADE